MTSEQNNDSINRALASHLEPLMPAPGWEQGVLAAMARRRRHRTRMRIMSIMSAAAAMIASALFVPAYFLSAEPQPFDYEQYIYTEAYYSALPRSTLSISEEFNSMLASSQMPASMNLVEPFTPLPPL